MSKQTKATLEDALQAHLLDEMGESAVMAGYALITAYKTAEDFEEGTTRYYHEYMDHQPFHASVGLVKIHTIRLEDQIRD